MTDAQSRPPVDRAANRAPPPARAALLNKIADLIEAESARLVLVETMDVGRTLGDSNMMVGGAADQFRYFASTVRTQEEEAQFLDRSTLRITLSEPIRVVGQIVPWNAPIMIASWKVAPALANGDTVVIKASSSAPLGVLDSGGKSANIVFPDCNWDKAVIEVRNAILENSGQVCCAGSRVLVHEDSYEHFLAECVTAFDKMTVGLPWEQGVSMAPRWTRSRWKRSWAT
jgi:acyl-CoA reductase-like NAD-dependent aldehyde dehydrogenase